MIWQSTESSKRGDTWCGKDPCRLASGICLQEAY